MWFGVKILEFIGGYVEYFYVPPFIGEWQQLTAERAVRLARQRTYSRLMGDVRSIDATIRSTTAQLDSILEVMAEQEDAVRSRALDGTTTGQEQSKTILATYTVHGNTVRKLRELLNVMARVRSELTLRCAILQTARDAISLRSSPDYVRDFSGAVNLLAGSEGETQRLLETLARAEEMDADHWGETLTSFIERAGDYTVPSLPSLGGGGGFPTKPSGPPPSAPLPPSAVNAAEGGFHLR